MDVDAALQTITGLLRERLGPRADELSMSADMPLIGRSSQLDSMQLVELCLAMEDRARDQGFEFDWTSEAAMSRSRSMFRTLSALAQEYAQQSLVAS